MATSSWYGDQVSDPSNTDLLVALTRVETKIDSVVITTGDHENRLRKLEAWRYALPSSLVLGLGSAILSIYEARNGG